MSDTPTLLASREALDTAIEVGIRDWEDNGGPLDAALQRAIHPVVQEPAEFVAELAAGMTKRREELWTANLTSPGGHIETLRQGKYHGFAEAQAMIAAALGATR